jgi:hypothetical protein
MDARTKHAVVAGRRKQESVFSWYWLVWALVSVIAFALPEVWVATHGRMDLTLSETVDRTAKGRTWFGWIIATILMIVAAVAALMMGHWHLGIF